MRKLYEDNEIVVVDEMPSNNTGIEHVAVVAMVFLIIGAFFGILFSMTFKSDREDDIVQAATVSSKVTITVPKDKDTTISEDKTIVENKTTVEDKAAQVSKEEVESKLSEIGDLTTYIMDYHVSEEFEMPSSYWFMGSSSNLDIECDGIVKVGYDIDDIKVEVLEDAIVFSIPKAEVLDNYVILDSVNFEFNQSMLSLMEGDNYQNMVTEVESAGLKQVEDAGIYSEAEKRLENIIRNYMGGFTDYEVRFM